MNTLSLHQLSMKVILLCLLVSGQRGQSIHLFDIRNMSWERDRVNCRFGDPTITSTSKKHQGQIVLKAFIDKRLCVVHYLKAYKSRTELLRGKETKLFISIRKPYKAVTRDTIRRWTKQGMALAGIVMDIFKPHSTRAASASKAAQSIGLRTILKTVGWRTADTFVKYYKKKIVTEGKYAEAVLS